MRQGLLVVLGRRDDLGARGVWGDVRVRLELGEDAGGVDGAPVSSSPSCRRGRVRRDAGVFFAVEDLLVQVTFSVLGAAEVAKEVALAAVEAEGVLSAKATAGAGSCLQATTSILIDAFREEEVVFAFASVGGFELRGRDHAVPQRGDAALLGNGVELGAVAVPEGRELKAGQGRFVV